MTRTLYRIGLVTQSLLYLGAGINHFWHAKAYLAIMPPHYTHPAGWIQFTGAAEMAGAIGLVVPRARRAAAWGIFLMLVGYFDVHFYMLRHAGEFAPIPMWMLEARIPLQFVLLAWAYVYTRKASRN